MKNKLLIAGNNTSVINDLFEHKDQNIELITSSMRPADLQAHVRNLEFDLFLYCRGAESTDNANSIISLRNTLMSKRIPIAIVSDTNEDDFSNVSFPGGPPELLLQRPITAAHIQKKVKEFLELSIEDQFGENKKKTNNRESSNENHISSTFNDTQSILSMIDDAIENIELGPKRILIIDDDPQMLKTIKGLLDKKYEIATAINGSLGRRFLEKKPVDLILLDYEMPNEDGPTVLKSLREDPEWNTIPVIFLTGINDVSKISKALSLKPQGYLLKPIDQAKLLNTIQEALSKPIEY